MSSAARHASPPARAARRWRSRQRRRGRRARRRRHRELAVDDTRWWASLPPTGEQVPPGRRGDGRARPIRLQAMHAAIREVGPRDGFQNEPERIATADKIRLIDALARTGLKRLEVASFVRADVIPQLADAADVLHGVDVPEDVDLAVLVPNERGLEAVARYRPHLRGRARPERAVA